MNHTLPLTAPDSTPLPLVSATDIATDFQNLLITHTTTTGTESPASTLSSTLTLLLTNFKQHLATQKLSAVSIKNYVSDVRQFLGWLHTHLPHTTIQELSSDICNQYLSSLHSSPHPANHTVATKKMPIPKPARSTTNRKQASLRQFSAFLHHTIATPDWGQELVNLPEDPIEYLINSFRSYLTKKRHAKKTVTNYLSDIRHYLEWATEKNAKR